MDGNLDLFFHIMYISLGFTSPGIILLVCFSYVFLTHWTFFLTTLNLKELK